MVVGTSTQGVALTSTQAKAEAALGATLRAPSSELYPAFRAAASGRPRARRGRLSIWALLTAVTWRGREYAATCGRYQCSSATSLALNLLCRRKGTQHPCLCSGAPQSTFTRDVRTEVFIHCCLSASTPINAPTAPWRIDI